MKSSSIFISKGSPEVLQTLMENLNNASDFLVSPYGGKAIGSPALSQINQQLCVVDGYFSNDYANLRGMRTRSDIDEKFEDIEINNLIGYFFF